MEQLDPLLIKLGLPVATTRTTNQLSVGIGGDVPIIPPLFALICTILGLTLTVILPKAKILPRQISTFGVRYLTLVVGKATFFCVQFLAGEALKSVGTELNFQEVKEFVSHGIFQFSRNPAYTSILAVTVPCIIICVDSIWMVISYVPLYFYINFVVVPAEEKFLGGLFGKSYESFLATTPRFLPDWVFICLVVILFIHFLEFLVFFEKYKNRKERGMMTHFCMTMVWGIIYDRSFLNEKVKKK